MTRFLFAAALLFQPARTPVLTPYELAPGFFVSLPHAPTRASSAEDKLATWTCREGDGMFLVATSPIDGNAAQVSADRAIAQVMSGLVSNRKGKVLDQKDLLLQGWLGLESRFSTPDGAVATAQIYSANGLILVIVAIKAGGGALTSMRSVFESVRLPGKGPLKEVGPTFQTFAFPDDPVQVQMPGKPDVADFPSPVLKDSITHAAKVIYGNRTYLRSRIDFPASAKESLTSELTLQLLETINTGFASQGKGLRSKSQRFQWGDRTVISTEFKTIGGGYGRIDSFMDSGKAHSFVVMVPAPLKTSAEVTRFFGSIRVDSK